MLLLVPEMCLVLTRSIRQYMAGVCVMLVTRRVDGSTMQRYNFTLFTIKRDMYDVAFDLKAAVLGRTCLPRLPLQKHVH